MRELIKGYPAIKRYIEEKTGRNLIDPRFDAETNLCKHGISWHRPSKNCGSIQCWKDDLDNWIKDLYCTSNPFQYLRDAGVDDCKYLQYASVKFPYPGYALKSSLDEFIEKHKRNVWYVGYMYTGRNVFVISNKTVGSSLVMQFAKTFESKEAAIEAVSNLTDHYKVIE